MRPKDVKDPFLACKLVVLDEMANASHKKLYMTDFMELVLRASVLRYPPRPMTLPEVVKSLQKLFMNHFYKHEALLDQFCNTVDQAIVQDRVEAFASAIANHRKREEEDEDGGEPPRAQSCRPSRRGSSRSRRPSIVAESADEAKPTGDDEASRAERCSDEAEQPQQPSDGLQSPQLPTESSEAGVAATGSCDLVMADADGSRAQQAAESTTALRDAQ